MMFVVRLGLLFMLLLSVVSLWQQFRLFNGTISIRINGGRQDGAGLEAVVGLCIQAFFTVVLAIALIS